MTAQAPFADWRVLELSNGIAVSYCAKMFADAGADVVKIESPQGDSLRAWSAGGPAGALFGYLAAGKKSVVHDDGAEIAALLAGADIVDIVGIDRHLRIADDVNPVRARRA